MSKLEQLKEKITTETKYLAQCKLDFDAAEKALIEQHKMVGALQDSLELALEIAEEVRTEKDDTFRESLATLYTSGRTDADIATAFAEAHVSPPAELQLPAVEEKEADDDKESNEAA